ncbi:MAG: class I SAM-dependent methyltransferase [Rhodospirillaceae bacterium]|nr:class I SAM-dependent methyltransferase [Rhodospirillaceae bacterium]MBT6139911.1 class I SAM-dependent methyltransferase [Rhodospirillaceae bacterium]
MNLQKAIVAQFKKPHGSFGRIAGWIMANRRSNQERNRWTVDLLEINPSDRVIEIGCGPGVGLGYCLERAKEGQVLGADHSRTMLDQARIRNAEASVGGRLDLQLGSFDDQPDTVGLFDKAYSANVIQFLPDRAAAFNKIYALLKPNGISATTYMPRGKNPSRAQSLSMAEDVKRHMKAAGFVTIRVEELPMSPAPAICVIGKHP